MKFFFLNLKKNHSSIALIISFFALLLTFLYAAFTHLPLIGEAPHWYYSIISYGNVTFDALFTRYLDVLVNQLPALIISTFFGPESNAFVIQYLSFSYTMFPLISLLVCFLYLKKKNRLDLFAFAILSTLFASMPTLPLSVGMAALALAVFWPLFYLIILRQPRLVKEYLYIVLGLVALLFSYEPSILLFMLIIIVSIFRNVKAKSFKTFDTFIVLFSIVSIIYLTNKILGTNKDVLSKHWHWIFADIDKARIYGVISIVTFVGLMFSKNWSNKKTQMVFLIVFAAAQAWILYLLYYVCLSQGFFFHFAQHDNFIQIPFHFGPTTAFLARTTAIPTAFGIGFLCLFWNYFNKPEKFLSIQKNKILNYALAVAILVSTSVDFVSNKIWAHAFNYYSEYVLSQKGCVMMPHELHKTNLFQASMQNISMHTLSVLIQILAGKKEVDTIVFLDESHLHPEFKDICSTKKGFVYLVPSGIFDISTNRINFSDTIK